MAVRKRILKPKKKRFHTSNPVYLTGKLQEYMIRLEEGRGYYLHKWGGGVKPRELHGHWRTFQAAEKHLILYIIKTNRTGLARYPECPEPRQTNYTRTFLRG